MTLGSVVAQLKLSSEGEVWSIYVQFEKLNSKSSMNISILHICPNKWHELLKEQPPYFNRSDFPLLLDCGTDKAAFLRIYYQEFAQKILAPSHLFRNGCHNHRTLTGGTP